MRLSRLVAATCLMILAAALSPADATAITNTLDYQVVFAGGTDTITGSFTFDNNALTGSITVTGPVEAGTFNIGFTGLITYSSGDAILTAVGPRALEGFFPGNFSSSTVFTGFTIEDFSSFLETSVTSTSVTNLAATGVPEPTSLALLGTALAGLGLIRRRKRV